MAWKNKEAEKEYKKNYHQQKKNDPNYRAVRKKHFVKWQKNNKAWLNKKQREYQNNENGKEYKQNYKPVANAKGREGTAKLSERYLKKQLKKDGFTLNQIKENPILINVKKITIKTKRLCKTLKN